MRELIQLGDIAIAVTRKAVKNVHLSVHPPTGVVSLVAPAHTRLEVARAYAISKLTWIRTQQLKLADQAREAPRQFLNRESHYVWGRRYLMRVVELEAKPCVALKHRHLVLSVRPNSLPAKRDEIMHEWHKSLLHALVPSILEKWQAILNVRVTAYFLQRMKTKWGSCNHQAGHIRLNTELVKKPKDLIEYVIVHEMLHLIEPTHSKGFIELLDKHYPTWREARTELNALPLAADSWKSQ
jgi:predicted metal-dependent hydrolase